MKNFVFSSHVAKAAVGLSLILGLAACGGGSDNDNTIVDRSESPSGDITPDDFTVATVQDARLNTVYDLGSFTVSGLPEGQSVTMTVTNPYQIQVERSIESILEGVSADRLAPTIENTVALELDGIFRPVFADDIREATVDGLSEKTEEEETLIIDQLVDIVLAKIPEVTALVIADAEKSLLIEGSVPEPIIPEVEVTEGDEPNADLASENEAAVNEDDESAEEESSSEESTAAVLPCEAEGAKCGDIERAIRNIAHFYASYGVGDNSVNILDALIDGGDVSSRVEETFKEAFKNVFEGTLGPVLIAAGVDIESTAGAEVKTALEERITGGLSQEALTSIASAIQSAIADEAKIEIKRLICLPNEFPEQRIGTKEGFLPVTSDPNLANKTTDDGLDKIDCFSGESQIVRAGDDIRARVRSSSEENSTVFGTVTLGALSKDLSVSTGVKDITPELVDIPSINTDDDNPMSLADQLAVLEEKLTHLLPGSTTTFRMVLNGFDVDVPVTIQEAYVTDGLVAEKDDDDNDVPFASYSFSVVEDSFVFGESILASKAIRTLLTQDLTQGTEADSSVFLNLTAPPQLDQRYEVTLNVGEFSQMLVVDTGIDETPDPIELVLHNEVADLQEVPVGMYVVYRFKLTGVNTALPLSVDGAEICFVEDGPCNNEGFAPTGDETLVEVGSTVRIRVLADQPFTDYSVTGTLGAGESQESFNFDFRSGSAVAPASLNVAFPPAFSATESDRIVVRGSFSQGDGEIESVKVYLSGVEVASEDDPAGLGETGEFSYEIAGLVEGENNIRVAVASVGAVPAIQHVVVNKFAAFPDVFPATGSEGYLSGLSGVAIGYIDDDDPDSNYIFASIGDNNASYVARVSPGNGSVTEVSGQSLSDKLTNKDSRYEAIGFYTLESQGRVLVGNVKDDAIASLSTAITVDPHKSHVEGPLSGAELAQENLPRELDNDQAKVISAHSGSHNVSTGDSIHDPKEFDVDTRRATLIVASGNPNQATTVTSVDFATGERVRLVSRADLDSTPDDTGDDNTGIVNNVAVALDHTGADDGSGDRYYIVANDRASEVLAVSPEDRSVSRLLDGFENITALDFHQATRTLIVGDNGAGRRGLWKVDVDADIVEPTPLSTADQPSENNAFSEIVALEVHDALGYAVVADKGLNAIFAVDLETGHRVLLSRTGNRP